LGFSGWKAGQVASTIDLIHRSVQVG
jgi:hypothetical protein